MGKIRDIYNIGCYTTTEYSILDIVDLLIKKIKDQHVEDRSFNDKHYYISNNKLKELW